MSEDTQRYRAPALDKGLDILELLSQQSTGLTRSEIVKELDRKPGEIYRMLDRLVEREYVSHSSLTGGYSLSMKLFLLGSNYPPTKRLIDIATPNLNLFAEETKQSIHLVVAERGTGIVVAQANGNATWQFRLPLGAQLNLLNTSSGLVLLAFQNDLGQKILYEKDINGTNVRETKIFKTLENIKSIGYRVADSQQLVGVTDITVPVLGPDNQAIAVVTCPYIEYVDQPNNTDATLSKTSVLNLLQELGKKMSFEPSL